MSMVKLSEDAVKKINGTLKLAAVSMRKLAAERDALMEIVAGLTTEKQVEQVKQAMLRKGINPWGTEKELDAEIRKRAAAGKLGMFKEAVDLSANLSIGKIGEVLDDGADPCGKKSEASRAELDNYVLNGG